MKKKNEVMDEIKKKLRKYNADCKKFDEEKEAKCQELDRDAFWEWAKSHDFPEFPVTDGQYKAWRLWNYSETDEPNFDGFVRENEAKDFIGTLRAVGVETLTITNSGTSLMENLHWFQDAGCKLVGLCEVAPTDAWELKHNGMRKAIRIAL